MNKQEFTTKVADIEKSKGEWKFLGERPAVIDFFATWCGPCKALAPVLDELAADYQYKDRIDFYKVDIDREQELAAVFGVRSVPTLLFIPLSGMPQMMTGGRPKSDLKRIIDEVLMGK
ncbi:MAG: thioredoxin family protein [Alistipes putredinis]